MLVLFVSQLYPQGYKEEKNCSEKFCWMILESSEFQKYAGKIYEVSLKASLKNSIVSLSQQFPKDGTVKILARSTLVFMLNCCSKMLYYDLIYTTSRS